ncbi:MAG: DUF2309 domain-containing protein [Chromatiaceae bacterium]|nr:DUF2309 domain-containing protein [Chromatiaceae bacterium]
MSAKPAKMEDIRDQLREAIAHFEHTLPGQAPIRDFVHHNTLHGFQHLHFSEALAAAERLTGARGYLGDEQFRAAYAKGRITREDLLKVLQADPDLDAMVPVAKSARGEIYRRDIYLVTLLNPLKSITASQLNWELEELDALRSFQADVRAEDRSRLLAAAGKSGAGGEGTAIEDLWSACLEGLGLTHYLLHPEDLVDLSAEQAQQMLIELRSEDESDNQPALDRLIRKESRNLLSLLLERVGRDLTLAGFLHALTGHDVRDELSAGLLRQVAGYLDLGLASWHCETRDEGFYSVWRRTACEDPNWMFGEMSGWHSHLESLPEDPIEAIVTELRRLGLRQDKWAGYLEQLALELPGWSGMFLWRCRHRNYQGMFPAGMLMVDYLAVRIVLEHIFCQRLCTRFWQLEASLDLIRWHFRHHCAEFLVRYSLYSARLPEYLSTLAQHMTEYNAQNNQGEESWWHLAHMVSTWRQSPAADRPLGHSVYRSAWPLFRLSQHLGLCGADIRHLEKPQLEEMLAVLERLPAQQRGFIWLQAYELHYRDQLLNALQQNHGRQPGRVEGASAQLVFCMDDREEGFRRHLEEADPQVETYGGAAHFNVPHIWRDLDGTVSRLTPVVYDPVHEICEFARPAGERSLQQRIERRARRFGLGRLLHQEIRRNLLSSTLLIVLAAPGALFTLLGKLLFPLAFGLQGARQRRLYDIEVPTQLALTAEADGAEPTPEHPRIGFTETEQLDRIETLLRNIGLIEGFSPLVVIMAHGSSSQNNPHLAAYDCGACSGRHSGPNARIVAAIANRPEIRRRLSSERGISIPAATWFLGAEHNTCNEDIEWYDLQDLPDSLAENFSQLQRSLDEARRRHAHERCRRLASAPRSPTPDQALRHIQGRALDFSQPRPELGHATNAAAFVGRRCMSRGTFFDRRVFLISYDHATDPDGKVLERLLLANAPVGAGISLEYYFSTVDNQRYGSGSKVTHNLTGLFGVMDGAASDLRTGLPLQMVEIHEAMRLQVVVEAGVETLSSIYARQPELQELIGNGWILLSALDPETGAISMFKPGLGFVPWDGVPKALPRVDCSADCYRDLSDPVPPALITDSYGESDAA